MEQIWEFIATHKDQIEIIIKILSLIVGSSSLLGLARWLLQRVWIKQRRAEVRVFEVIKDINSLLPKVYGSEENDSPLADHNIIYQSRDRNRDIQSELRQKLNKRRYLLIVAPTGYGKTREACTLSQSLLAEGYRIIRIKPGWLDVPKDLPTDLNSQRTRILILLDDLNGLFRVGDYTQSPKNESLPFASQPKYHERLCQVLDTFEKICGRDEIRVIATARNEAEEWGILKYHITDNLWKRFGEPYELDHPTKKAMINFLDTTTVKCGLISKQDDLDAIVATNQGAYRNIVQNLRRLTEGYRIVSKDVFIPTLNGSWRENYEILIEQCPPIQFIYDAIDILQQTHIGLYMPIVLRLALLLWGGDHIQQISKRKQLANGMSFLVNEKKILPISKGILIPYDGQIKERGTSINWEPFYSGITYLALLYAEVYDDAMLNSLSNLYVLLSGNDKKEEAEKIQRRILKLTAS